MQRLIFLFLVLASVLFPIHNYAQQSDEGELISRREVQGFVFEKRRLAVENTRVPEDRPSFRTVHEHRITDAKSGKILLSVTEEFCAGNIECEGDAGNCDVNFDGYPDLRILLEREPARYAYYVYVPENKAFEKHPFSDLYGQYWDEAGKTAGGYYFEYGFPKTNPLARIDRVYKGIGLKEVSETRTPVGHGRGE